MSESRLCLRCNKPIPEERGPAAFYCTVDCRDKARDKRAREKDKAKVEVRAPSGGDGTPSDDTATFTWRLEGAESVLKAVNRALDRMDLKHDPVNEARVAMARSLAAALDDGICLGALQNYGASIASVSKELRTLLFEMQQDGVQIDGFEEMTKELSEAVGLNSEPDTKW